MGNLSRAFLFLFLMSLSDVARGELGTLDPIVADAVRATQQQLAKENIKDDALAITVIDMRDPKRLATGSFRGDQPMFPASVVKLFYLAYSARLLEDGKMTDSDELRRGLRDMIVDSSNDA